MKRFADQTLYEILEVDAAAPAADIAAAYERAQAIFGPGSLATYTLMSSEDAALLTSRIEEAGRTLLDPEARSRYDRSLQPPGAGEIRAAVNAHGGHTNGANGANGTSTPFTLPPVIPALQPAGDVPAPARDAPPAAAAPPPAPSPGPIRLEREIRPAAPTAPEPPAAAEAPPAPPPEPSADFPLPEGAQWTGEALRRVREARGISIQQIAERTKVTRYHVENVEAERFSALPAPVYLRGILLSLARELRLDGQKVARAYLERCAAALKK